MSPERKRRRRKRPVTPEEAAELIRFQKNPDDPVVWEGIYQRHHRQNIIQATRFLDDDQATGEEIVQEAYLQAKAHAADIEEGLERYIFGSIKNLALNWGRDHHREIPVDPRPPRPAATDAGGVHSLATMPVELKVADWDADDPTPPRTRATPARRPTPSTPTATAPGMTRRWSGTRCGSW
jgi:DNA-directed RNA polymerase specialized sigma24 family protein